MHPSNPSIPIAVPTPSTRPSPAQQRSIRRILRTERELLVDVARRHLGSLRQDAEDLVHDVYLAALQGDLHVSSNRAYALDDLLHAVISAADRQAHGDAP